MRRLRMRKIRTDGLPLIAAGLALIGIEKIGYWIAAGIGIVAMGIGVLSLFTEEPDPPVQKHDVSGHVDHSGTVNQVVSEAPTLRRPK